jgi:hypothetical protein
MRCLGKIFLVIFFIKSALFAGVEASLDSYQVQRGERVTLTLKIDGNNIQRPKIVSICGNDILSTASQTNIEMINGDYKKTYSLNYDFMPVKSCVIDPIEVVLDSKTYKTKPLKLEVLASGSVKNANFLLELTTNKKEVYVGEPFLVTLVFKQKNTAQVVDNKFMPPKFKGFWIKAEGQPQVTRGAEYVSTKLVYKIAAQRAGKLSIDPAQMAIATRKMSKRDMWGSFMPQIKWRSYFSNELKIDVKPLPNNATLVGDFTISATVDKTEINPNEAVNVTIKVHGEGNLEDIASFKPYIQGVSVFDEKPEVKDTEFTQKIALVADEDFVVPSFSLAFFNLRTKQLEKIKTQEIKIKVNGNGVKKELEIKRETPTVVKATPSYEDANKKDIPLQMAIFIFIAGVMVGVALMLVKPRKSSKKRASFNYKDEKQLLVRLLPLKEDPEVQAIIDTIEANLYSSTKQELNKKQVKEILQKYEIA